MLLSVKKTNGRSSNHLFCIVFLVFLHLLSPVLIWGAEKDSIPAAIPVLTQDEAEKANADATAYALAKKEEREPFHDLYEKDIYDTIAFEGTIKAVSQIPDPEKNDYSNCLYALFVEIDSFHSDSVLNSELACEAIINVPIMKERKIVSGNIFLPGDKISCVCAEYDMMPQEIQEIQLSDDIQSFEHQQYFTLSADKITSFSENGRKDFAKRAITFLPIQTLPGDDISATTRANRIKKEIERIENELNLHGGSFESWKEEYQSIAAKYMKLCDENWKGWIGDSFFAAGGTETKYKTKEYIEGILPYKKYLEQNNIDLIILRYPSKWDFAARVLAAEDFQENPAWVEHYYECLKNDIEIIDPMPELWEHRFDYTEFYFYQDPEEIHPFEGYAFCSAQLLSKCLERYSYTKDSLPYELKEEVTPSPSKRHYYPEGNEKLSSNSLMPFHCVYNNGKRLHCTSMTGSPFLIISNSLFLFPSIGMGAGFPQYLAYNLGATPDFICQEGQTNSMLRSLISNPLALSKRKAVIMPGGYFMWNGFPPFPKYLFDNPQSIALEKTISFQEGANRELEINCSPKDFDVSTEGGSLNVERKDKQSVIAMSVAIPPVQDKKVCMIRVLFKKYSRLAITVKDKEDDSIIEPECEGDGFLKKSDLFVPVSDSSRDVILSFRFLGTKNFQIEKIEFWYY